ncbi:MAG: zinc-binding dehydrogenase [Myxococcota bacterium]
MNEMIAMQAETAGPADGLRPVSIPLPDPGPGQVRIRVVAASVNFSDVMRRRASPYPFPTTFPYIPGGEVAGIVDALGPDVEGPAVGTPVFAVVGTGGEGGYAQYAIAVASRANPIPPQFDLNVAAGLIITGVTAVSMLRNVARLEPGETVLVPAAAGGVGSLLVQVAKVLGAGKVIALASTEAKRATARRLGADVALDPAASDLDASIREAAPNGVDVLFEMAGGTWLDRGMAWLAPFGRAIVYGSAGNDVRAFKQDTLDQWLSTPALGQTVTAFNLGLVFGLRPQWAQAAMQSLIGWIAEGKVEAPVGHVLPLTRAAEAHDLLEGRASTGKIVLNPWPEPEAKVVAEARGYRFELSHGGKVLAFRWTSDTEDLTTQGFCEALTHYAAVTERYRPQGLLVDVQALRFPGPPPEEGWRDRVILPRYLAAGSRRMAYIGFGEPGDMPAVHDHFAERRFADEASAMAWLQSSPSETK